MSDLLFCPNCFSENELSADVCAFCQTPLSPKSPTTQTTGRASAELVAPELPAPCHSRKIKTPPLGFALLLLKQPKPLLVEAGPDHASSIYILGRVGAGLVDAGPKLIDLTDYGALKFGVSRRHAEIRRVDGRFALRDLESTNGTWLNQTRLAPHMDYPLQSNDQIVLGRLVAWVCLGSGEASSPPARTRFALQATPGKMGLSLAALRAEVLPFLEGLAAVQQVLAEGGKRPFQPFQLYHLGMGETAVITLEGSGLDDAIQALRAHLTPWCASHPDLIGAPIAEFSFLLEAELMELAAGMLADYAPNLSPEQAEESAAALRPWLEYLVTHPLTLL